MSDDLSGFESDPPGRPSSRLGKKLAAPIDENQLSATSIISTKVISALGAKDINVSQATNVPEGDVQNIELIERRDQLTENSWRRWAIGILLTAFVLLNAAVLTFIYIVWRSEIGAQAVNRIVTEHVMLALIAGSVAQLGALALGLGRALTLRRS